MDSFSTSNQVIFHANRPCIRKEEHVGRKNIIQHAFARLGTTDVQSFAIIGLYKTGKSSFINYIKTPTVVEKYLGKEKSHKYRFLCLDFAEYPLDTEAAFFRLFYQEIEKLLGLTQLEGMVDLEKVTQHLDQQDLRLILILDNFNLVITNPNFNIIFYDGLRSWFSTHVNVGCIVTSPLQLLDLAIPTEIAGSPFFNIFDSYSLTPLTLTEATQLLDDRLIEALRGHEREIFDIIDNVGLNPYELQVAGYIWAKHFKKTNETSFKDAIDEVYQMLHPYYNDIYSSLTSRQRRDIGNILKRNYQQTTRIDRNLIDRGWVTRDKKNITAKLMTRYFCQKLKIDCTASNSLIDKIKQFFQKLFN